MPIDIDFSAASDAISASLLGTYAKTEATLDFKGDFSGDFRPSVIDGQTGEILDAPPDSKRCRAERYALKSVVNRLLPASRTAKCARWRVPAVLLQVHRSVAHRKAFYTGLQVCASVWACPVCAAKISERRRSELIVAVQRAQALGMAVKLLTLTVPHGLGDDLPVLLARILDAWRRTTTGRSGKASRRELGIAGSIRAFEVTYGANGWHPHLHVLLFLREPIDNAVAQASFTRLWQDACCKAGLPRPSDAHGCRIDDGSKAARYASKWGLESELTKSHAKHAGAGSLSPWDLLRASLEHSEGWQQCEALFRAYAAAFKGKRQLYWSNGLRAVLSLGAEASDDELAAIQDDDAIYLADISDQQWRAILATRSEALVLDIAEACPDALPGVLADILADAARTGGAHVQAPSAADADMGAASEQAADASRARNRERAEGGGGS